MILLKHYRTFEHTEELNEAIRLHLREHQYELNATAIKALEIVSRHAVKYTGAAWLKIDTLAAMLDKSPATTRRALALLERAGIIERVSFMRRIKGGNGGNIIRILPADPVDDCPQMIARANHAEPTAASVEAPKAPTESIISLNKPFKPNKKTLQKQASPATFHEHLRELISDKKARREYVIAFKKQTVKLLRFGIHADKAELLETIAIRSLYITLKREQNGSIDNSIGYFYGTLRNQIDQALFSDMDEVYSANPDDLLAALPY